MTILDTPVFTLAPIALLLEDFSEMALLHKDFITI